MIRSIQSPSDLQITPRDRRFARSGAPLWWRGSDPVSTAVYNALSATFPKGEAFFIESVRRHRAGAPPQLDREIAAFIQQEVAHSREHLAFNRQLDAAGYDIAPLNADVDARLDLIRERPAFVSLSVTTALEHFTAILAHALLADPRLLENADPEVAALWRWHAIEEIEHKGVAYDTWLHATRDWPALKRWLVKNRIMLRVTRNFLTDRATGALRLLAQDGIGGLKAWGGLLRVALVNPGILRMIALPWARYFLPGFHPWQEDDRALIAAAERIGEPPLEHLARTAHLSA